MSEVLVYPNITYENLLKKKNDYKECPEEIIEYMKLKHNLKNETIIKNCIGLLNKINGKTYDVIINRLKILNYSYLDSQKIDELMDMIITKASTDHVFCDVYVKMCNDMSEINMNNDKFINVMKKRCDFVFYNINDFKKVYNDMFMIFISKLYMSGFIRSINEHIEYLYEEMGKDQKYIYMLCNLLMNLGNRIDRQILRKMNEFKETNINKRNKFKIIELLEKYKYV